MTHKTYTPEEIKKYYEDNKDKLDGELSLAKIDIIQCPAIRFICPEIFRNEPSFKHKWVMDGTVQTAAADGNYIMINPIFWSTLDRAQKMRAVFHEGGHNMFGDMDLKANTDDERFVWNLVTDGWMEALANTCGVGRGNYCEGCVNPTDRGTINFTINGKKLIISEAHNKSKKEMYDMIWEHVKKNPGKGGKIIILDDNGNIVGTMDQHMNREFDADEKIEVEQKLRKALMEHKMRGTMPGGLADMIEGMLKGKINWRAEVRECILPEIKSFQSYRRPSRRGACCDFIRPTAVKEGVTAVIALDTSGSIGTTELNYFTGEISNLFKQFEEGMVSADLLLHHCDVYDILKLKDVKDLNKIRTHSGGTSHLDVFAKAEEMNANILICFTDGYSEFPESTTIKKVLWICTDERGMQSIPDNLGKKIFVDIKDFQED